MQSWQIGCTIAYPMNQLPAPGFRGANTEHKLYDSSHAVIHPPATVRAIDSRDKFAPRESHPALPRTQFLPHNRNSPDQLDPSPFEHYSPPRSEGFTEPFTSTRTVYTNAPIIEYPVKFRRLSQDSYGQRTGSPEGQSMGDYDIENNRRGNVAYHSRRRPLSQDEFDGPAQYLPLPLPQQDSERAQGLVELPSHLDGNEQDELIQRSNEILSECTFHFVAKYQFPIPLERDKPRVLSPADREWTEWAYLLKRLATKRRIPARVLYDNQIRQFVTTLENSIVARDNPRKQRTEGKRRPKDDRYILQLLSAGTQVAKILMDSLAMQQLDDLYKRAEAVILERRRARLFPGAP